MKEVKKCSISGVAFTMDADAYQELENYLDSLKKTYKDTPDGAEIVADIEARIAELILTTQDNTRVVEKPLILNIIHQMGSVEDIYPAPPLPRHGERQTGRRMRRHRQVLRRRSRMDPAGHVPADPAELPALDSVHGLDGTDDGQPVRHLRHLLRYHVVRRTGGTHGTPETRNERRKNHRTVDPGLSWEPAP